MDCMLVINKVIHLEWILKFAQQCKHDKIVNKCLFVFFGHIPEDVNSRPYMSLLYSVHHICLILLRYFTPYSAK